ncbi:phospholipase D-like domain-containing protein [Corallococcus sp. M7]
MRFRESNSDGLIITAITGTHVVMLGIDLPPAKAKGLLGFAIRRVDPEENEDYYLQGMRTFEASYSNPPAGVLATTLEHPVQDFFWSDFSAKPGRSYTYEVMPVRGRPKNLRYDPGTRIEVMTEPERLPANQPGHSIWFNRAVIGSQAYSRKWTQPPNKLEGQERADAYKWLSRRLEEALIEFIGEAKKPGAGLRAALYEFSHEPFAAAFAATAKVCKDVKIVYDGRIRTDADGRPDPSAVSRVRKATALLEKYELDATPRRSDPNNISHNKFIVLLQRGQPVAVWTGSTNLTESGVFGHANVGHLVRDRDIAQAYLDYWNRLAKDPAIDDLRKQNQDATPTLAEHPCSPGITPLFSPRKGIKQLQWYADEMDSASTLSCFTGAFGVNKCLLVKYQEDRDYLRYLFLERWGMNAKVAAETREKLGIDPDVMVAVGTGMKDDMLLRWLHEQDNTLSTNVKHVHLKFILLDAFGPDPTVITGSANFSDASTSGNDENMLIIRGDRRVADIYAGEFMRLWRHHRTRAIVNRIAERTGEVRGPRYLDETSEWTRPFFKKDHPKFRLRTMLAEAAV